MPRVSELGLRRERAWHFNVMEACVANGIKRLIYSSSASVYGDALEER
jgi:UDP-glucose 4-epimerase